MKTGFLVVILVVIASCMTTYILLTSLVPDLAIVSESSHVNLIDPVVSMPEEVKSSAMEPLRLFHVAVTASADPYSRWQCRIMYYWYKKMKAKPDGSAEIGGFTRVLHTGKADGLMDEIPTFVVNPLPPGKDHFVENVKLALQRIGLIWVVLYDCIGNEFSSLNNTDGF